MSLADEATTAQILHDLRRELDRVQRALISEKSRTAILADAIREGVKAAAQTIDFPPVPPPPADTRKTVGEDALLVLSDWQLGKVTPSYSSEVCEQRIELYLSKVDRIVALQRRDHPVRAARIFLVGDMVEGELIFPGQAHLIDSSLYQQVVKDGPRILGSVVRWAASRFDSVTVHAVPGNHGHLGGRSRKEMHRESNADRMLYDITRQICDASGLAVDWFIAEDWWHVADLGDRCRFLLLHGDQVRGYAGIPWYGWMRKVLAWSSMERIWPDMEFDHVIGGHFHTPVSLYVNGRRLWINASTESHNPYALEQLAAAGEPAQWLLFARPGFGVTAEYLISLQ
jgi:hypothetical protein